MFGDRKDFAKKMKDMGFKIEGTSLDEILNPYSFHPYVTWGDKKDKVTGSVYSDRLYQWDSELHDDLCLKYFGNKGQTWNPIDRSPEVIEKFLRDYLNDPELKLVYIEKHCHMASGYPIWFFAYYSESKEATINVG